MTKDIAEKISNANKKVREVGESLAAYRAALSSARIAFEELAQSCAVVISQPYIEIDTSQMEG